MNTIRIVFAAVALCLLSGCATETFAEQDVVDQELVNARVDARLHQILKGLLRAQTEQATLVR